MLNIEAVISAARESIAPVKLFENAGKQTYFVAHGRNGDGESFTVDTEAGAGAPLRKRGVVTVFDVASFNMVIKDNSDAGNVAIYIDRNPTSPAVVAVLNGHGPAGAGWGDFRAEIKFRPTPQWVKWTSIDGKMMDQTPFAEFIEDNLEDIATPSGATMLEIATYLEATRTANFKSGVRLANGMVQFQNLESIEAKVGAGAVDVPEVFTLALSPIQGVPSYGVPARFRYRIVDGRLKLGIKLQRVEDLMDKVLAEVLAKIERGTNISVFDGIAPSATR